MAKMDLTTTERDRRWIAVRDILERHDVDLVIAFSDFGDQSTLQRYFSNFRSGYDYMASMLYRSGELDLITTHPGTIPIAQKMSWASNVLPIARPDWTKGRNDDTRPTVGGQMANQLARRGITRVGVAGMEFFPSGWKTLIEAAVPDVEFVDLWDEIHHLRLVKSADELKLVREACRISDLAWERMGEIVKPGRKRYEVLADLEQIIRAHGCEDSFNLCMSLPMLQDRMDRYPHSALPIEEDGIYMIEVSPRFLGYYGQQTGLVATGSIPVEMQKAYDAANRSRDKGLEIIKPGVDLIEVEQAIRTQLRMDGYDLATPSFGHAVGMELEDFHINGSSLVLEEGMTFIFHPLLAGHPAVMRADTYVITSGGADRLTSGSLAPLQL
jgi:Xaa-Pro aminopeptidase